MLLDTFTIYSLVVAAALCGAGLLWLLGRRPAQEGAARSWALALAGLALYFGLVLASASVPRWLGTGLANGWAVLVVGVMVRSAALLCHRPFRWRWHLAAAAAVTLIVTGWLSAPRHTDARVVLVGAVTAVQCALVMATFRRRDESASDDEMLGRRVLAVAFGGVAVMQVLRVAVHAPLTGDAGPAMVSRTPLSAAVGIGFLVWAVVIPVALFYVHEVRASVALRATVEDLRAALSEVKTLRRLLPMCAGCRSIREEGGRWSSVDVYLARNAGVEISHGLCPDCLVRLYPDIADRLDS